MTVILSPRAQKSLLRIPKSQQRKIARKLMLLEENPLSGKKLGGNLLGRRALKAWPYRVIYIIHQDSRIEVSDILHRQGAYKK